MEVFQITPASAKPLWFLGVVCVLIAAVLFALLFTAWAARHSRVEVHADELRLVGDFWGRSIPLADLDFTAAEVVDLEEREGLRPRWRTFGTGVPGYASGWFRLKNGDKALLYLSDRRQVAYIPTRLDYALLVSVEQPEQLLDALRRSSNP